MAWCHQATSHYLGQCWPRSMLSYGVTRPQWVLKLQPHPGNDSQGDIPLAWTALYLPKLWPKWCSMWRLGWPRPPWHNQLPGLTLWPGSGKHKSCKIVWSFVTLNHLKPILTHMGLALFPWGPYQYRIRHLRDLYSELSDHSEIGRHLDPGGRLNIKMLSYQYRDPHVKDKTVSRPSYL